ncbi:MAG: hypothetical protein HZA11_13545 [Nitrospirae bacterium]|nr:hypothetical protein [Nitrospirota bacterium]
MKSKFITAGLAILFLICAGIWVMPGIAMAHCDTLDGPVVATAKAALENGDLTPVLKWVKKDDEQDIRELFQKTLRVRKQGKEAKELADMYFFETLVRIHRAGEGAPYTGLKPGGTVEPSIAVADKALENGSVDNLVKMVSDAAAMGIHKRFEHAKETKKHADESVEAGRKFVEAYVEFTHYVERLYLDAAAKGMHHGNIEETKKEEHHH